MTVHTGHCAGAYKGVVLLTAGWFTLAGLSACASPPARVPAAQPAVVTPDNLPPSPPAPPPSPPEQLSDQPPSLSATHTTAPPCTPALPSPKPQHRHKHKTQEPPKEGPPKPQTLAETPPGALVNAQVGQISSSLMSILGKKVQSPKGEDLGRVVDVLADSSGHVRVAIIDFGGFLGVGTRRIAVDWPLLRFDPGRSDKSLILSLSREKLRSAPEYKDSTRPRVLMPPPVVPPSDAADTAITKK